MGKNHNASRRRNNPFIFPIATDYFIQIIENKFNVNYNLEIILAIIFPRIKSFEKTSIGNRETF